MQRGQAARREDTSAGTTGGPSDSGTGDRPRNRPWSGLCGRAWRHTGSSPASVFRPVRPAGASKSAAGCDRVEACCRSQHAPKAPFCEIISQHKNMLVATGRSLPPVARLDDCGRGRRPTLHVAPATWSGIGAVTRIHARAHTHTNVATIGKKVGIFTALKRYCCDRAFQVCATPS